MFRFIGCLGIAIILAGAAQARPDRNAFLNQKATTMAGIVRQIRHDPQVRDRFLRHYAGSVDEIIAFLKTLKPARLQTEGLYHVYSAPPDGRIKGRIAKLKKGTPVYVDASGVPHLVAVCANPLSTGKEKPEAFNPIEDDLYSMSEETLRPMDAPVDEAVAEWTEPGLSEPSLGEYITEIPNGPEPQIVVPPVDTVGGGSPVPFSNSIPGWSWALPVVGVYPGLIDFGSDKGVEPEGVPAVPEPATVGIAAAGLLFALYRRRKR